MNEKALEKSIQSQTELPLFGEGFLNDHAGHIITDPHIALVELIANAYDAGATKVEISWPNELHQAFVIFDNGTGMTKGEFEKRWKTLCYNRTQEQGIDVSSPNRMKGKRIAFGKSGKGRHGAFCFTDSYQIETWKDGYAIQAEVVRTDGGTSPFRCDILNEFSKQGHGTEIRAVIKRRLLTETEVKKLIGAKFAVDPSFEIHVNKYLIQLLQLKGLVTTKVLIGTLGYIIVHRIEADVQDRTVQLRGIAWWVNNRAVGTPSWEGLDGEGAYLDGRTSLAKKYTFVVEADILQKDVKDDWEGFRASAACIEVRNVVHRHVIAALNEIQAASRKERKKAALEQNRSVLQELPHVSQNALAEFVEHVQETCPTLSERDLFRTAEVFAKMERARSGYDILKQLNDCSPQDLDKWNKIMQEWSAGGAEVVLNEMERRLRLIQRLMDLVDSPKSDELHDLQPLFERGLWMFGPEYEAVDFHSNRYLATIVRNALGGSDKQLLHGRPDFVALPDRSIGIFNSLAYGDRGEIVGIRKILIVELKKGGFKLTQDELDQARNYAKELYKASDVQQATETVAYVLGSGAESGLGIGTYNNVIKVIPMLYRTLLENAQARTFNLQRRLEEFGLKLPRDPQIVEMFNTYTQASMQMEQVSNATSSEGSNETVVVTSEQTKQEESEQRSRP